MLASFGAQLGSTIARRRAHPLRFAHPRGSHGFTLLETFIALVILGFSLAGLAMLMVGNMQTGREARRFSAASSLAQQKLEDLRANKYDDLAASGSPESLNEQGGNTGVTLFSRSWTVANGATAGTKDVAVTVTWTDSLGTHNVVLNSKMAQ